MSVVRLGAVEYLNARPLVFGLDRIDRFSIRFDVPSRCAARLHDGSIDVGLIPSIEYLRPAAGRAGGEILRIVPDLAVASRGPVASVAIYATRAMADVRSIAMDTSSRTSVALARVMCARAFKIDPVIRPHRPDLDAMLSVADAALIIGDNALLLDESGVMLAEKIDLGHTWTEMTGLPFVYAFWAGRVGALDEAAVALLQRAKEEGLRQIDAIVADYFGRTPQLQAVGARYLRDNIKYNPGPDERAGLELFYRYAAEAGVVEATAPLQFF